MDAFRKPKYAGIKKYLLENIENGHFKTYDKLPSENELVRQFNISHITARKAMSDLASEGRVYRVQGKGSFVSPPQQDELEIDVFHHMEIDKGNKIPSQDSSYINIFRGIGEYTTNKNIRLRTVFLEPGPDSENKHLEKLIEDKSQGALLFLTNPEINVAGLKKLHEADIPYVLLDRSTHSYICNFTASNNLAGGYMQTAHLTQLGHRRIVYITTKNNINTEKERYMGYREAMADICPEIEARNLCYDNDFEDKIKQLINKQDISALAVVNDVTALYILQQLEKIGVSVPGDLSLIGFDDWEPSRFVKPALTTIKQDFMLMGRQAAQLLHEAMKDNTIKGKSVQLPVSLVVRDSTAVI